MRYVIFRLFIVPGGPVRPRSVAGIAMEMFEQHQGTHILQVHCLYSTWYSRG